MEAENITVMLMLRINGRSLPAAEDSVSKLFLKQPKNKDRLYNRFFVYMWP